MPQVKQVSGLDQIKAIIEREGMQVRRQVLEEERARLLGQVAVIEKRLGELGGERRSPRAAAKRVRRSGSGRRPGGVGLRDFVVKAFQAAGKNLTTAELAAKVVEVGYKTSAKPSNLRIMLVKAVKDRGLFRKVKRGVYGLKK